MSKDREGYDACRSEAGVNSGVSDRLREKLGSGVGEKGEARVLRGELRIEGKKSSRKITVGKYVG